MKVKIKYDTFNFTLMYLAYHIFGPSACIIVTIMKSTGKSVSTVE